MSLVVFDLCMKPEYYEDLHRLLALPSGSIVKYDYRKKYFSPDAYSTLTDAGLFYKPLPILLMYAQRKHYVKGGGGTPEGSVTADDNIILIATRTAELKNVFIDKRTDAGGISMPNIHFHMKLMEYPDPDTEQVRKLTEHLLGLGLVPFDHLVVTAPQELTSPIQELASDDNWTKVVHRIGSPPSQFSGDVFWRVNHIERVAGSQGHQVVAQVPRATNQPGAKDYFVDYSIDDLTDYRVRLTHLVAGPEAPDVPASTRITIREDTAGRLELPDKDVPLRRNDGAQFLFSAKSSDVLRPRYSKLLIDTTIPGRDGDYPVGSSAELSVKVEKPVWRVVAAVLLVLATGVLGTEASALANSENPWWVACAAVALLAGFGASMVYSGNIKFPRFS